MLLAKRRPFKSSMYPSLASTSLTIRSARYLGQLYLSVSTNSCPCYCDLSSNVSNRGLVIHNSQTAFRGLFPSRMSNFGIQKNLPFLLSTQPTGRIGTPEDFAGLVLYLCSRGASHVTSNVIEIDGGSMRSGWRAKARAGKGKI